MIKNIIFNDMNKIGKWIDIAVNYNGSFIAALDGSGYIQISRDYGQNWYSYGTDQTWKNIACSFDGSKVIATEWDGRIHISDDFGVNWSISENNRFWSSLACSYSGQIIVASVSNGKIYISNNYGSSWYECEENRMWKSVCCNSDGSIIYAASFNGYIYKSEDFGLTWSNNNLQKDYVAIDCSSDGSVLACVTFYNDILISKDYGVSFISHPSSKDWNSIKISKNQSQLIAVAIASYEKIYISNIDNQSQNIDWDEYNEKRQWASLGLSHNGSFIIAGELDGSLYSHNSSNPTCNNVLFIDNPLIMDESTIQYFNNFNFISIPEKFKLTITQDGCSVVSRIEAEACYEPDARLCQMMTHRLIDINKFESKFINYPNYGSKIKQEIYCNNISQLPSEYIVLCQFPTISKAFPCIDTRLFYDPGQVEEDIARIYSCNSLEKAKKWIEKHFMFVDIIKNNNNIETYKRYKYNDIYILEEDNKVYINLFPS